MEHFFTTKNSAMFNNDLKMNSNQVTDLAGFRTIQVSNIGNEMLLKPDDEELYENTIRYNVVEGTFDNSNYKGGNVMQLYLKDDYITSNANKSTNVTNYCENVNTKVIPKSVTIPKPRGRMSAYAFFIKCCHQEHKVEHPGETVIFLEFGKKCSDKWKAMSESEKKTYYEMAMNDKMRYEEEMKVYTEKVNEERKRLYGIVGKDGKQNYLFPDDDKKKKRKQMPIKDPNAPKRYLSPFFWFCKYERGNVKALNPEYRIGDMSKELGRQWNSCTPDVKQKYEAISEQDKARYEKELIEYNRKDQDPLMQVM